MANRRERRSAGIPHVEERFLGGRSVGLYYRRTLPLELREQKGVPR